MTEIDPIVGELSEAQVLEAILRQIGPSSAEIGPGDDAAVLAAPGERIVATVDTLVHGPDFRLAWSGGYDLGWKSAAVNLADIAAMGARPTSLLVALAMPDTTPLSFVTALAAGLRAGCEALAPGCAVEGGDLTVSDTLTIAVTALGVLDGVRPVRRDGARPGDVVAIAGETGLAARGLGILFDRFRDAAGAPVPVDIAALRPGEADAITAQLRPTPPIGLGPVAARAGATAMMDVSDGLALDARRMATASAVTIDLASASIGGDVSAALAGGEDHALLATFPPGVPLPPGFHEIGAVGPAHAGEPLHVDGRAFDQRAGWDPYQDWDSARG
jgi:thiamine-monophosphate kinase